MPYKTNQDTRSTGNPWAPSIDAFKGGSLSGDIQCDYLIIGAGFTGLSIAYNLLKQFGQEKKVVLIDSHTLGSGASGRNSGMLGPGIGAPFHRLEKKFGPEKARTMFQHTLDAVDSSIALIKREAFDCDLTVGSQFKVSTNSSNDQQLRLESDALHRNGFELNTYDEHSVQAIVNGPRYRYALEYSNTATINPVKLLRALADKITALGGEIILNSACTELEEGHAWVGKKRINFERAVISTNGFSHSLGIQKGRVIPVSTSLMMSSPLSEQQRQQLALKTENAVIDNRKIFNYFRLTADNRLIFGGGAPFYSTSGIIAEQRRGSDGPGSVYKELSAGVNKYLPDLTGLHIEKVWTGTIGVTLDNFPVISSYRKSIDSVIGWCGHGLALSLAYGAAYAQQKKESSSQTGLYWHRKKAPYLSPIPLLPIASNSYIRYLNIMDNLRGG